jgi:hypothetical protein
MPLSDTAIRKAKAADIGSVIVSALGLLVSIGALAEDWFRIDHHPTAILEIDLYRQSEPKLIEVILRYRAAPRPKKK